MKNEQSFKLMKGRFFFKKKIKCQSLEEAYLLLLQKCTLEIHLTLSQTKEGKKMENFSFLNIMKLAGY